MEVVHSKTTVKDLFAQKVTQKSRLKVDLDKCTGCGICSEICSNAHASKQNQNYYSIRIQNTFPKRFKAQLCTHCFRCIKSCPRTALFENPVDGHVQIDPQRCDLCVNCSPEGNQKMICVMVCPTKVIKPPLNDSEGPYFPNLPLVCDFCGGLPECIEWCPNEAISLEAFPKHE
jgi:anaerobic carbon-monoxide dehydrogenase iron sulfur subunit